MRFLSLLIFLGLFSNSRAQERVIPSEKPKLIIGITVSEMRYDYLKRYWDKFGNGGFKRLINQGTYCRNVHHDYLLSESAAGYASIATGAYPDVHGMVSEYWYDRLKNEVTYCISDDHVETVGGSYDQGRYSPSKLMVSTLSDEMKLTGKFQSKVISVALDPVAAVISGGHTANAAYWYDNTNGKWITSSYYQDSLSTWVKDFNAKAFANIYLDKIWEPFLPLKDYTESLSDTSEYEKGLKGRKVFPYDLSKLSAISKKEKNYELLKYTPFGNSYTKDFAISAIVNEKLGKDNITDWLMIGFSSSGYAGNNFNSWSVEMEDIYLRLDKDIEHFLNFVDNEVGLKNVLIYMTGENAVANDPAYLIDKRIPSGYFNYNASISLLKSYLNLIYGTGDWIKFYYSRQLYLNTDLIESSKLSLIEFQNRVARFMIQFEGVANVLTSDNLITNNYTRGAFEKIQKSYNQKRSGDILINLEAGWVEKGPDRQEFSSFHYDTHVPLVWYGWKIGRDELSRRMSVTDIMPTIANFLDLSRPAATQGEVIKEMLE
jgi:predicted AlkP superfamily pyrophosphatase or phosphodiesterase